MVTTTQGAPAPAVMTTAEVAAVFSVHETTVQSWVAADRIGHFRTPGGHLRFHRSDVVRLLAAEGARLTSVRSATTDFAQWVARLDELEGAEERRTVTLNDIIERAQRSLELHRDVASAAR